MRLLLENGADVEAKGSWGKREGGTALHLAAKNGREAVVRLLLENGAAVEAKGFGGGGEGRTAIQWTAKNGKEAVVRLLQATKQLSSVLLSPRQNLCRH